MELFIKIPLLLLYFRYTVMVLLRELDPTGVRQRRARQMTRRVYSSKVNSIADKAVAIIMYNLFTAGPKPRLAYRSV